MDQRLFKSDETVEYFFDEGCHILEILNSPMDPEASIVRARVGPGVTTDWHRLRGTSERYVILDGTGEAGVGDDSIPVGPGDVVFIPAMERQRIRNTGSADLVFLAICTPRFEVENYLSGSD